MTLFRYILPISLALYFIWRARKQRLFLLGIPFLQVMGNSIFFENARMFWWPGRLGGPILILLWIFVTWFFICVGLPAKNRLRVDRNSWFGKQLVLPDELFIVVLIILWCINFGIAFAQTSASLQSALNLGTMFIGYFLLRGIFANVDHQEITQFIEAVIVVNIIASILYILSSGLRLPIYLANNYLETTLSGVLIIRTFWVSPRFSIQAIAYLLSKAKWNISTISMMLFMTLELFFHYSRNLIILLIVLVILSLLISGVKNKYKIKKILITIPILLLITGLSYLLIITYYPQSFVYFSQRFIQLSQGGVLGENSSLVSRLDHLKETYHMVEQVNPAIGIGFIDQENSLRALQITSYIADSDYVGIVYRYGIIGVICFICFFACAALRGLRMYLFSQENSASWFWLACLLWIFTLVWGSIISNTFFDPRNYALALWMFALVETRFVLEKSTKHA